MVMAREGLAIMGLQLDATGCRWKCMPWLWWWLPDLEATRAMDSWKPRRVSAREPEA